MAMMTLNEHESNEKRILWLAIIPKPFFFSCFSSWVGDKMLLTATESTACAIACAEWSRPKSEEEKKMAGPGIGRRTVRQAVVVVWWWLSL